MEEVWKDIPGYPHYQASNQGRIKSLSRLVESSKGNTRRVAERVLKPIVKEGYLFVNLSICGKHCKIGIHQAVARTFFGPPSPEHVVDHLNSNKEDNRPENLEYVTPSENTLRAHRNGLTGHKGEKSCRARLSNAQVHEIRLLKGLETSRFLARRYGVSVSHIKHILAGRARKAG